MRDGDYENVADAPESVWASINFEQGRVDMRFDRFGKEQEGIVCTQLEDLKHMKGDHTLSVRMQEKEYFV